MYLYGLQNVDDGNLLSILVLDKIEDTLEIDLMTKRFTHEKIEQLKNDLQSLFTGLKRRKIVHGDMTLCKLAYVNRKSAGMTVNRLVVINLDNMSTAVTDKDDEVLYLDLVSFACDTMARSIFKNNSKNELDSNLHKLNMVFGAYMLSEIEWKFNLDLSNLSTNRFRSIIYDILISLLRKARYCDPLPDIDYSTMLFDEGRRIQQP